MKRKYACFGRLNEFLGEVVAASEHEALALAKLEWAYADKVLIVCPGNDLGVQGVNWTTYKMGDITYFLGDEAITLIERRES